MPRSPLPGVTRHVLSFCPYCGCKLDASAMLDPAHRSSVPAEGDTTVCIDCAEVLIYRADQSIRKPEPGEIEAMMNADPEVRRDIMRTQAAVRAAARPQGNG